MPLLAVYPTKKIVVGAGGIPEQVKDGVTGCLIPPKDAGAMAKHILMLLTDDTLRRQFSLNTAQDARERFDLNHQVDAHFEWYRMISDSTEPKMNLTKARNEDA
jgi:glycosyltransferase involved in cell wall biosynthesis